MRFYYAVACLFALLAAPACPIGLPTPAAVRGVRNWYAVGAIGWLEADVVAPRALRAGDGADLTLDLRSTSSSIEGVDVGVHGIAGAHLGLAAGRVVLRPGVRRQLEARLQLPTSATPGHHQLVLELRRQLDPDATLLVPFELEVLAAPVPAVTLRRSTLRRRGRVRVENPSDEPIRVAMTGSVNGAVFRFRPTVFDLEPGGSKRARVRVVSRSRFGRRTATIGAATGNAAGTTEATVVGRSRVGPFVAVGVALVGLAGLVVSTLNDVGSTPDLETAAAARAAAADVAPDEGVTAGSTPTSAALELSTPSTESADTVPGAALPGAAAPGAAAPGGGVNRVARPATGDCTTPDGGVGWALRGHVLANGVASISARPAGFPAESATAALTDEGGFFSICPLAVGDYLVTAVSEGYFPLVVPARLAGASTDLGDLPLRPGAASLIGVVQGPAGPVAGATVIAYDRRREVGRAVTDERGEYLVIGLPAPADLSVQVTAPGMALASWVAEVRTDGRVRQPDLVLTPG